MAELITAAVYGWDWRNSHFIVCVFNDQGFYQVLGAMRHERSIIKETAPQVLETLLSEKRKRTQVGVALIQMDLTRPQVSSRMSGKV